MTNQSHKSKEGTKECQIHGDGNFPMLCPCQPPEKEYCICKYPMYTTKEDRTTLCQVCRKRPHFLSIPEKEECKEGHEVVLINNMWECKNCPLRLKLEELKKVSSSKEDCSCKGKLTGKYETHTINQCSVSDSPPKKKICTECQFEESHSQACSKYKVSPPPSPKLGQEWEEEFRNIFPDSTGRHLYPTQEEHIKTFIRSLLSKTKREVVICAAIRMDDGYIIRGHRHNDCLLTASKIPRYKDKSHRFGEDQGFVTSENRYVDRLEAARIQKAAGIISKMPPDGAYLHGECYSEDLY